MRVATSLDLRRGIVTVRSSLSTPTHSSDPLLCLHTDPHPRLRPRNPTTKTDRTTSTAYSTSIIFSTVYYHKVAASFSYYAMDSGESGDDRFLLFSSFMRSAKLRVRWPMNLEDQVLVELR